MTTKARDFSHLKNFKKSGDGYTARCPFHDDHRNSLSISDGDDDRLLVHCHAGCENVFERLVATIPHSNGNGNHRREVAAYDYRDATGKIVSYTVRYEPKEFLQCRPDGHQGGRIWNLKGVPQVPFHLPELTAAGPKRVVFICEGEKDVLAVESLGFIATTNRSGAVKWTNALNEHFHGRNIVILPHNDKPGREHGEKVASSLSGIAASIKVINLPGLEEHGDVSDWIAAGGTSAELRKLVRSAREYKNESAQSTTREQGVKPVPAKTITAADLLAIQFAALRWSIMGLLAEGLFILAGRPKLGKSWLVLNFAIAISCGGYALGTISVEAGDVLYCALEDGERRLQQRLRQMLGRGSTPANLYFATEWKPFDRGGLEDLEEWLKTHPNARLTVFDTLERVRPSEDTRARLYHSDYTAVQGLQELAKRYQVCILVVHHTRKQEASDHLDLVSGSTGLTGAADGVLILKRARGEADATLTANGRDFPDTELALKFDSELCDWRALGNAADYRLSNERRDVIELLRKSESLPPKIIASTLGRDHSATKKLLWTMAKAGEVHSDSRGRYTLVNARDDGNPVTDQVTKLFPRESKFVPPPEWTDKQRADWENWPRKDRIA